MENRNFTTAFLFIIGFIGTVLTDAFFDSDVLRALYVRRDTPSKR